MLYIHCVDGEFIFDRHIIHEIFGFYNDHEEHDIDLSIYAEFIEFPFKAKQLEFMIRFRLGLKVDIFKFVKSFNKFEDIFVMEDYMQIKWQSNEAKNSLLEAIQAFVLTNEEAR
jgi:hypothetical protein